MYHVFVQEFFTIFLNNSCIEFCKSHRNQSLLMWRTQTDRQRTDGRRLHPRKAFFLVQKPVQIQVTEISFLLLQLALRKTPPASIHLTASLLTKHAASLTHSVVFVIQMRFSRSNGAMILTGNSGSAAEGVGLRPLDRWHS